MHHETRECLPRLRVFYVAARSFAVWLRAKPDGCACGWYFLFPEHGVAVVLAHGTWMSWDGRVQPHCSAVPCVPEGDRLLSLFASLPANLCSVFEREQACGGAIAARQARDADPAYHRTVGSGSAGVFQQLDVGTPVMLRWVPEVPAGLGRMGKRRWGQSYFRWVACKGPDAWTRPFHPRNSRDLTHRERLMP